MITSWSSAPTCTAPVTCAHLSVLGSRHKRHMQQRTRRAYTRLARRCFTAAGTLRDAAAGFGACPPVFVRQCRVRFRFAANSGYLLRSRLRAAGFAGGSAVRARRVARSASGAVPMARFLRAMRSAACLPFSPAMLECLMCFFLP